MAKLRTTRQRWWKTNENSRQKFFVFAHKVENHNIAAVFDVQRRFRAKGFKLGKKIFFLSFWCSTSVWCERGANFKEKKYFSSFFSFNVVEEFSGRFLFSNVFIENFLKSKGLRFVFSAVFTEFSWNTKGFRCFFSIWIFFFNQDFITWNWYNKIWKKNSERLQVKKSDRTFLQREKNENTPAGKFVCKRCPESKTQVLGHPSKDFCIISKVSALRVLLIEQGLSLPFSKNFWNFSLSSCSNFRIFTSSHLRTFSSWHLLIVIFFIFLCTSSHRHVFSLLPSSPLALFRSFSSFLALFSPWPPAFLLSRLIALLSSCSCSLALFLFCFLAFFPSWPLALLLPHSSLSVFSQQQKLCYGGFSQISTGSIRCNYNTSFRTKVADGSGADAWWGSGS